MILAFIALFFLPLSVTAILIGAIAIFVLLAIISFKQNAAKREEASEQGEMPKPTLKDIYAEMQRQREEYKRTGVRVDPRQAGQEYYQRQAQANQEYSETEQPRETPAWTEPPRTEARDTNSVEVAVESNVPMASFILSVDGRVIGYVGQQKAVLTFPSGMHQMTVEVNDSGKKKIYDSNILFNTGKTVTISKKLGGYSVKVV